MSKQDRASVQIEFMHVCDYAFSAENGKACIIGIFEWIRSMAFPATHPLMCIAVQFRGQPGHIVPFRVAIEAQDGSKVFEIPETKVVLDQDGRSFGSVNAMGITFPGPGRYSVVATTQGEVLATKTLKVLRIEQKVASA